MITERHHRRSGPGSSRWRSSFGFGGMAAAVAVISVGVGQVPADQAYAAVPPAAGGTSAQTATYYASRGLGNCSYPGLPADELYVALSPSEYRSAAACGGYLQVKGPGGSVRVKVVDQCPGCAAGHIDLSETAFARLAPLPDGLIKVTYAFLSDPSLPGPVSIEVKQGSSRYWLALLADNTGNPLASVQVQTAAGWRSLARASYNYWIARSGSGPGPFTVRLTDTQGHQVTVHGITLSPGAVQPTTAWMYGGHIAPQQGKSYLTAGRHDGSVGAVCRGAGPGTRLVARSRHPAAGLAECHRSALCLSFRRPTPR